MPSINSKQKGSAFERRCAQIFRILGWDKCRTSREENKRLDAQGVDLTNTAPFLVQCKAQEKGIYPHDILAAMPVDGIRILFHKRNRKGIVVSMFYEDFETMVLKNWK